MDPNELTNQQKSKLQNESNPYIGLVMFLTTNEYNDIIIVRRRLLRIIQ
jgi:hypothetical protein